MRDEVDASADAIWDSVGSVSSRESGSMERQPHTDAEWTAVRRHAVVLLEASNLLMIPGRKGRRRVPLPPMVQVCTAPLRSRTVSIVTVPSLTPWH